MKNRIYSAPADKGLNNTCEHFILKVKGSSVLYFSLAVFIIITIHPANTKLNQCCVNVIQWNINPSLGQCWAETAT